MPRRFRVCVCALVGLAFVGGTAALTPAAAPADRLVRLVLQKAAKKKARVKKGMTKAAPDAAAAKPAVASSDGPKFSKDVAPILVNICTNCHEPRQKRGKLDMTTFEKLMQGTPTEKVIVPGKPDESHLVLRIKGEETPKMPPNNQRTVSEGAIAKIEAWVKAGALLDAGIDPKAALSTYAASPEEIRKSELSKLSTDDRDKKAEAVGLERWKKASPKATPVVTPSAHFLYFATMPKERASAVLKSMESQYNAVKSILGNDAVEWGEKASFYVFNDAAALGEFIRTVEQREPEGTEVGTSRMNVPEPYVAVIDPSGGRAEPAPGPAPKKGARVRREAGEAGAERSLLGLLTEWFTIGSASKVGKPPRWVSLGLAAYLGSLVEPRGPYYQQLRQNAFDLMVQNWASKANDALGDTTKTDDVRAVGFALHEWMASVDRQLIPAFDRGMLAGQEKLDDVIEEVLNGKREDFLGGSAEFIQSHYGGNP